MGLVANEQRSQHKLVMAVCRVRQEVTGQTVGSVGEARVPIAVYKDMFVRRRAVLEQELCGVKEKRDNYCSRLI